MTPKSTTYPRGTFPVSLEARRLYHAAETVAFFRANAESLTDKEIAVLDARSREVIDLLDVKASEDDDRVPF